MTHVNPATEILNDYSRGVLSRAVTMRRLALSWYGDLLLMLHARGIPRPQLSAEDAAQMLADAGLVLDGLRASGQPKKT